MRLHRWLVALALALAAGLAAPREAAATCDLTGPYLGTGAQLPLGCPAHVYVQLSPQTDFWPKLTVLRSGVYVDATGTSTTDLATLTVNRMFIGCPGSPDMTAQTLEDYQHHAILPKSVSVGEQIGFGTGWLIGIEIVAAAPCPAAVPPTLTCTELAPCFKEPPFGDFVDENSGCAAGGGGGPASGLGLLGLVALRRRARRRRRR
jgi:uncharacterized protein (TIGR03382 family)